MQLTQFDAFALFNAIVMNPALYGLTNIEDGCVQGNVLFAVRVCGLDDEAGYLFWDDAHPTTVAHKVLGGGFAEAIASLRRGARTRYVDAARPGPCRNRLPSLAAAPGLLSAIHRHSCPGGRRKTASALTLVSCLRVDHQSLSFTVHNREP